MTEYSTFDWPAFHAQHTPNALAARTVDTGFQLTWAELEARTGRLAHLLTAELGIGRGDRVSILADSDARYFEVQFALFRLHAIFVPLNVRNTSGELAAVILDAGADLIIHDPKNAALAAQAAAEAGATTLEWDEESSSSRYRVVQDPEAPSRTAGRIDPTAVAQIMYTSGTTGKPKGVMITHGQLAANAINVAQMTCCAGPDAHVLNYVPLFHAGGMNVFSMPALYWGGRVTTTKGFDAKQAFALLCDETEDFTITNGVLQMYERMAELEEFAEAKLPAVQQMLYGGFGPTALETYLKWLGKGPTLILSYGSTELGPMACINDNPGSNAMAEGAFGRPFPLTEVKCVDDAGDEVAPGANGKIVVRGPSVTSGYWGRPGEGFDTDGWFSIDDVGYFDEDGQIHISGRLVERYRSGGENIYPAEVEAAYLDLPGVRELAVTGVPDDRWGEVGLLAIVPEPGATFSIAQVREHATDRLSRFKLPQHLIVLDELPRSTTLKVARNHLRTLFAEESSTTHGD